MGKKRIRRQHADQAGPRVPGRQHEPPASAVSQAGPAVGDDRPEAAERAAAGDSPLPDGSSNAADAARRGTQIELHDFSLWAGNRQLLRKTSINFVPGQVTLLLGCSGVGKSLLLRILAGLIDSSEGPIRFDGLVQLVTAQNEVRGIMGADVPVAVVFQNFALLDELSPLQNVRIALDHTRSAADSMRLTARDRRQAAERLLEELRVPNDRPTGVLSGGQRQRLAIARAIGIQTDVILYDEPTSGLDVNTAAQVADLIRETQERCGRTSIIVTHDHETLSRIADRIVLLDHHDQTLREIPQEHWGRLPSFLGDPPSARDMGQTQVRTSVWQGVQRLVTSAMRITGQCCEEAVQLPWSLLPLWKNAGWGLRFTWHYLNLVAGWSAWLYIGVAGMIIGYVAQDFVFRYLPFRQITESLLTENLLHATGFSLYRFLVPILATILIAARSGAAVAADVGSKVYGNQMDALRTLGVNPHRVLRTPVLYAFLIGTPLLTFLSYFIASILAAVAFLLTHPELGIAFWDGHFHQYLRQPGELLYRGTDWLLAKLLICGAGIGMIAWRCGSSPKQSGPDISHGVTRTILWSTLFVLLVHFVFSLVEFEVQK